MPFCLYMAAAFWTGQLRKLELFVGFQRYRGVTDCGFEFIFNSHISKDG